MAYRTCRLIEAGDPSLQGNAVFTAKLQRSGTDFIIVVPNEEVDRLGLNAGQDVTLTIRPTLSADLEEAFDIEQERGRDALRYLADH